jgi:imidazolonepropionase-like amidohydrolase
MKTNCNAIVLGAALLFVGIASTSTVDAQIAVRGNTVYTMAGPPIKNGVVVIRDGRIIAIGTADTIRIPEGYKVLKAKVVTPGLIDAHSTVGLSGIYNVAHDQDQLEHSDPIQPELRALDAFNAQEPLLKWVRSFGVTTVHTGHAPGELISGQTLVAKTAGTTVESAVMYRTRTVAATLSSRARKSGTSSPGTRGKMISMLRTQFIKATEYKRALEASATDDDVDPPPRDLRLEALVDVLARKTPLMVTAHRAQDIAGALRLAKEFDIKVWLDGAAEAYLLLDEIKAAGVPVIIHPTMARPSGDLENLSFETAATLLEAGIPMAMQSGYEAYVPKTRVVLFEAAMAAANGLTKEQALAAITREAAKILGVDDRIGTLEVGKDGDVALFDGDPFEYTTHCVGTVIEGRVVSREKR